MGSMIIRLIKRFPRLFLVLMAICAGVTTLVGRLVFFPLQPLWITEVTVVSSMTGVLCAGLIVRRIV